MSMIYKSDPVPLSFNKYLQNLCESVNLGNEKAYTELESLKVDEKEQALQNTRAFFLTRYCLNKDQYCLNKDQPGKALEYLANLQDPKRLEMLKKDYPGMGQLQDLRKDYPEFGKVLNIYERIQKGVNLKGPEADKLFDECWKESKEIKDPTFRMKAYELSLTINSSKGIQKEEGQPVQINFGKKEK